MQTESLYSQARRDDEATIMNPGLTEIQRKLVAEHDTALRDYEYWHKRWMDTPYGRSDQKHIEQQKEIARIAYLVAQGNAQQAGCYSTHL